MPTTQKKHFLLLFRSRQDEPDRSPQEMEQIVGKYMAWMKAMKDKGQYLGGDRLNDAGRVLRAASVTDGPYAEAKEAIGGYMMIAADSIEQATEIAKGCPGLNLGTIVEVRPLEQMPAI